MSAPTHPRFTTDRCAKCQKTFAPGDRVQVINIVVKAGRKSVHELGAWLSEEFELGHINCQDPQLTPGLIVLGK